MKRQIIRAVVLYNLDYIAGCAVLEFFFAICILDIEQKVEREKEKTVSEVGA